MEINKQRKERLHLQHLDILRRWEEANKDMLRHEDKQIMFDPLIRLLHNSKLTQNEQENCLSSYMYMGHHKDGHYCYKHNRTRQYVTVSELGKVIEGKLDTKEN